MSIPTISLANFATRRDQIKAEIIHAAETVGFFVVVDQEKPGVEEIEGMFREAKSFFDQPDEIKRQTPHIKHENTGWERNAQIRPSTGTPDQKESLQLQYARRGDNWPTFSPTFTDKAADFMLSCQDLSVKLMSCLAEGLGFESDLFTRAHRIQEPSSLTTLRLLHYHELKEELPETYFRAGKHTDFDVITVLFTKTGEEGLEVCPGRTSHTSLGCGDDWIPVPAKTGNIVINVGDMLMAFADDRFKSNFHRVRLPRGPEAQKPRYSIAYFNQPNKEVVVQGPAKKYEPLTAEEYISSAMERNFRAAKLESGAPIVV